MAARDRLDGALGVRGLDVAQRRHWRSSTYANGEGAAVFFDAGKGSGTFRANRDRDLIATVNDNRVAATFWPSDHHDWLAR